MSRLKIDHGNYICSYCKHAWSQPTSEVPRCPKCPPKQDDVRRHDLYAVQTIAEPDKFWAQERGKPPVEAIHAGLFTLDSDDIANCAAPHLEDGKCRLVHSDDLTKLINSHQSRKSWGHYTDGGSVRTNITGSTYAWQQMPLRYYTSAERKEMPVWTLLAEYFPDAFTALARHSKKCNDKHNPGERMHWAREKSKDHLECAARHLLTPDRLDEVSGETELVAALWRIAAEVQLREEKRLVAAGIHPLSGVVK